MIVLEVAFVLVNLAVPYWIWTSKSHNNVPAVEREAFRKNLFEITEVLGGFPPCDSSDVVETIDDLCNKSRAKLNDNQSVAFERAAAEVVFRCLVKKDSVLVQWAPQPQSDHDMNCGTDHGDVISLTPSFVFNMKGQIRRLEYSTPGGQRQAAPMINCRNKLKGLQALKYPPDRFQDLIQKIGQLPNDASDWQLENRMCMTLDPNRGWDPWRKRYGL